MTNVVTALKDDFKLFLQALWDQLDLPSPTRAQYAIADYLQHGPKRLQIQAFRGVGKSWITGAFVLWTLFKDKEKEEKSPKTPSKDSPEDTNPEIEEQKPEPNEAVDSLRIDPFKDQLTNTTYG